MKRLSVGCHSMRKYINNNSRHEIDFSENNDGIYLLQIIQEDKILIKKIVKK